MNAAVVDANNLSKDYGSRRVVDSVSLHIQAGEVLGLLGPNGSGKSTILKMLTGCLAPTDGAVSIAGFDLREQGARARAQLGYVPEDAALYPQMWVDEFLNCMGGVRGLKGAVLKAHVTRVIDELDLGTVRRLAIGKLSRGYRQRVAIAQALIHQPALLILDEPTNGLDPHQVIELRALIARLAPAHTVLITSHVLSEIEKVATRVAILLDGKLLTANAVVNEQCCVVIRAHGNRLGAHLLAVPGVISVKESKDTEPYFELEISGRAVIPAVANALYQAHARVFELREARRDLETVFLKLTTASQQ